MSRCMVLQGKHERTVTWSPHQTNRDCTSPEAAVAYKGLRELPHFLQVPTASVRKSPTMATKNMTRFSSCRGVSFEVNPHAGPFSVSADRPSASASWLRLCWMLRNAGRVLPVQDDARPPLSRSSNHFCDVDSDDEHADDADNAKENFDDVEKQLPPLQKEQELAVEKVETAKRKAANRGSESRLSTILFDQGLFTVYRRLFAVFFTLNMAALGLAIAGEFPYGRRKAAAFAIYNVLALTFCRSEVFFRVVFWFSVKALGRPWVPLRVKTAATSFLQSVGGIHSGCGMSSVAWLVYALVLALQSPGETSPEIIGVASAILSLLLFSCLAAFPVIRHLHHNFFERTHRFAGWTALALLWIFIVLKAGYEPKSKSYGNLTASKLVRQEEIWLTFVVTLLIVIPWVTVRRVPVTASSASGHASVIKFAGGVKAGLLGRISRSPLSEWHAFGIISDNKESHMMLVGAVGDFTKGLVSDPPSHLWVRGVHFAGLPYLVHMYNRVVLVATGSGIAPFLSFLLQPCAAEVCLVWITKSVDQNFGADMAAMLRSHPHGKLIINDTAVSGRPDMAPLAVDTAKALKAEVVIVTSNPQGSRDVVNACKAHGIAAFGPIWDS